MTRIRRSANTTGSSYTLAHPYALSYLAPVPVFSQHQSGQDVLHSIADPPHTGVEVSYQIPSTGV